MANSVSFAKWTSADGITYAFSTEYNINNFYDLSVDWTVGIDVIPDPAGTEATGVIVKLVGSKMAITFNSNVDDKSFSIVGTGSGNTTAIDQFLYLFSTFYSKGTGQILDRYRLLFDFSASPADSGTATSATSTTLTDTGKSWTVNQYANNYVLKTTGGTGPHQYRTIVSNTSNTLTIDSNDNNFDVTPDATTTYQIIHGMQRRGSLTRLLPTMVKDAPTVFRLTTQLIVGNVL